MEEDIDRHREREGVQNNLLYPEARTSSYCGGHRLSAAPRSEHYSACFNDAQNGGRGVGVAGRGGGGAGRRETCTSREENGDVGCGLSLSLSLSLLLNLFPLFFSTDSVTPTTPTTTTTTAPAFTECASLSRVRLKRFSSAVQPLSNIIYYRSPQPTLKPGLLRYNGTTSRLFSFSSEPPSSTPPPPPTPHHAVEAGEGVLTADLTQLPHTITTTTKPL